MTIPIYEPLNGYVSRVFSWSKRCLEEGTFRRLGGGPGIQISLRVGAYPYRHPDPPPNLHLGLEWFCLQSYTRNMLVLGLYFVAYIVNFLCLRNITAQYKIYIFEYWCPVLNEESQNQKPFNGWHLPLWGGGGGPHPYPELPQHLSFALKTLRQLLSHSCLFFQLQITWLWCVAKTFKLYFFYMNDDVVCSKLHWHWLSTC